MEGPGAVVMRELRFAQLQKMSSALENIRRTVVRELMCTMRMLVSRRWLGVRRMCPGFSGKLGIRNRAQLGVPHFFPLIGLPKIRSLGR